jgi:ATP-binding cassette subfamily B (MDR/TAP) protein 1
VVAVVPQEPFLFAVSIHENIPYRHEGVTEATFSYVTFITLF